MKKLFPLDIHYIARIEEGDEFGLDIILDYSIRNISEILKYFHDKHIGLISIEWSTPVDGRINLFIVFKARGIDPNMVIKDLSTLDFVHEVNYSPRYRDSIIYSRYLYPVKYAGERVLVFTSSILEDMFRNVYKMFGDMMGHGFLRQIGVAIGYSIYEEYVEEIEKTDIDTSVEYLNLTMKSIGWGEIDEYEKLDKGLRLRLDDSLECETLRDINLPVGSALLLGIFNGYYDRFYKVKIVIKEVKCISKGDPYCLFEIIPPI